MNVTSLLNNITTSDNMLLTIVIYFINFCLKLKIFIFIYNVYFHPLCNIPGPKLLQLSSIVKFYYQFRGTLPSKINNWHKIYGPVFRIGANEISVIDQYYSMEIYCNQNYKKSKIMELLGVIFGKNLFTIRDRINHIKRKKMVGEAFNKKSLIKMERIIWEEGVKELIEKLENNSEEGQIINLMSEFHYLTFVTKIYLRFI
jgi:cytochrome P450